MTIDKDGTDLPTHLVGIGASAGGLEALERLFRAMPTDTGMAFVVIQHLSPDFKSLMNELLERFTTMSAIPVIDTENIKPNTIYLLSSRKDLTVEGNLLISHDREKDVALSMPINTFFRSLAASWGERAIAVVLSGTGTDGSHGILDIRDAGGMVLVETPESARFNGMPQSAINTGVADAILPPEAMPKAMQAFVDDPAIRHQLLLGDEDDTNLVGLPAILNLLKHHYKIDFSNYKPATIMRRIGRRVAFLNNGESIEQYSGRLKSDHEELNLLYKDLLIGVTRFFRDPEAFQILRESVIPQIVAQTDLDEEIRVWVCGCSTGEEAYSIAILFLEAIEKIKREPRIKVLATDLHEDSITFAAEGVYSEDKFTDMPLELRKRYFETHGEGVYKVIPNLRKCLIFSAHNILKDPPFTRLHMVSCRNLLIYFQPSAQARTIATLHYSLNLNGIMFLGASETLGDLATEMEIVDRQCKIYRKIKESSTLLNSRSPLSMPDVRGHTSPIPATQLPRLYDNLLEKYVPGGVLVNERREILHIFGDASRYIHASSGRFSTDVLNMVSHPIALALTTALRSAAKHQNPVILKGIHFENEDKTDELLTISVDPFMDKATNDQFFMIRITSELLTSPSELLKEAANFSIDSEAAHQVCELEGELQKMRESLQSTVEELETTNEELQASNEELLASNEELQSTNEELHSVNEELYSVNAEHELKIEELNRTTSDLRNLMQSTDTATIFIDYDGKIRLYTPRALEIFSLFPQDIGRELKHFKSIVPDIELFADIEQIQRDQIPIERHIEWGNEKTYIRRCMVYQNVLGKQQGVVINYIDTSQVTHTSQALYNSESRLRGFMEHTPTIAWVKDAEGRYIFLNAAYEKRFGIKLADWLGKTDAQIWPAEIAQKFRDNDLQVLESGQAIEIEEEVKEANGTLSIWRSFKFLIKDAQNYAYVAGIGIDITERKKVEAQLAESEERLRLFIQNAPVALAMFDAEMRYLAHSKRWLDEYKLTEDVIGQRHYDVFPEIGQDWKNIHQRGLAGETIKCDDQLFVRANGSKQWLRWEVLPWHTANGKVGGILIFTEDITVQIIARQQIEQLNETLEQRVAERTAELEQEKHALQKSEQQLGKALLLAQHFEAMVNSSQDAIISKQLDGTVTSWNKGAEIVFGYSAEEMLGQSVTRLTPPNYEAEEQSILQRIWHGEVIKHYETQHVCKDGRIIDVSVTLSPIRDSEGKIVGASKIARDITAAKAAEAKLRASEMALRDAQKMLRTMIDVVPTMLSRWDKNEICLAANRAYADRFGLPVASLPGKSYRETLGEALYQQKQPYLQQVLAGESVMFESESPRADGRGAHHAIVRYLPDLDNGAVNGFYVEEEDVSEVVEARETAKARAAEFRSLVESVPVSILVSDASGQIVEVNRELERLFGYSHKELIGQSIETLVPEQFHTHHKEYSSTFQKGYEERDKSSRTDLKGRHKDGTLIPVSISIRGLGNTVDRKVVASIVDMRRSKAIETELEQAKQKAEIANQAKSSFLSTMSHEIRTPLNAIIGMSYVLNSGSLSAEQKEEVNSIEVASKALLALINDILDISKIEEGELTLDSHPFSLTELLNDLRLLFTPMVESKGLIHC